MHRRRSLALLLLAPLLLAADGPPARAASGGIRWAPSIATALAQARERHCPVMVALNMDGERGNDRMVEEVYRDASVVAAAAKCVCTIGSLGTHAEVKDAARGQAVCARFGSLTCAEHRAVERIVREDWLKVRGAEDVNCPQHFFLAPDGRRLFQRTWTVEPKELAALLQRAVELSTPETLAAWDTVEGRFQRAGDPLAPVREEALKALAAMKDPKVDAHLGEIARGAAEDGVRCDVLDAFAEAMGPARLEVALDLMASKSDDVRMHAACALEGSRSGEGLRGLVAALGREKDGKVRGVLFRAIAGCSPTDTSAKVAVLAGLKERSAEVLPHAVVALAPWAADEDVVTALKAIAFSRQPAGIRAAACWVLGKSGRKELAPALREMKDDGGRWSRLGPTARMAAQNLTEGYDALLYRRALRGFAPTPVRHPGDIDE